MLGMHGTYEANMTMQNCDVLLAVGARFDDRVIGNPKHFASGRAQDHPHRHRPVVDLQARQGRHPIVGDVKDVLQELIAQIKEPARCAPTMRRRAERLVEARSTSGASATA
jgi:acetolactate synthase-1/2/3 large subunit